MKHMYNGGLIGLWLLALTASAGDPQIANLQAGQRAGTKLVDITYDVAATGAVNVSVAVSTNNGLTYDLPVTHVSGDCGSGVTPGKGKAIVWDAGADWDGKYSAKMRVKVTADDGTNPPLPPDPASVAPALEDGVVTLLGQSTACLYTGANPVQTGVAEGTINPVQAAVLKGRVMDGLGAPLSGVTVSINNHPELGQTLSRTNGQYDLVVNGGGVLHVNFKKNGYLSAQRTLDVPWQDYLAVGDVTLITAGSQVSVVSMPSANWQVAVGSLTSDARGERRPCLLIPPGTRAWINTYAGGTQETATLTLRFTEYTVGASGPSAMPGDLPATVAYTYCVEAGADESQATVNGSGVMFSSNVFMYVANFLRFPAGTAVPLGYYDSDRGVWVPAPSGVVLDLKGANTDGLAIIALSTNGVPASDAELLTWGITADERRLLAQTFAPAVTQSVWRTPMTHFTQTDANWSHQYPNDAVGPTYFNKPTGDTWMSPGKPNGQESGHDDQGGYGSVNIESRVFRESLPIAGTPFTLNYSSSRMPGSGGAATVNFPLSGNSIPASLKRIEARGWVAGRTFSTNCIPATNLQYTFTWDGKDDYGRVVRGHQRISFGLGYVYDTYYTRLEANPAPLREFGFPGYEKMPDGSVRGPEQTKWRYLEDEMFLCFAPVAVDQGLGDWTIDVQHVYNPASKIIYFGDGTMRMAGKSVQPWDTFMATIGGNGTGGFSGDGGPATNAAIHYPTGIAVAPDGSIYFCDWWNNRIRRIDADGIITTMAGNGTGGFSGDGGLAINASLSHPQGLAFGPDGSLYVADASNHRIRRIGTDSIIATVAGSGADAYSGDNGLAVNAGFGDIVGLAVGRDGVIYVAEFGSNRIRRIAPDGYISTCAGNGAGAFSGDGGSATNASLQMPNGVAVASDGALLIADSANNRVRRVGADGIITTVAGNGAGTYYGDGESATNAALWEPYQVLPAAGNAFYVADFFNYRVRYVDGDGIIRTVAGNGTSGYSGDNGPATAAKIQRFIYMALDRNNRLCLADYFNNRIRRLSPTMPAYNAENTLIPSEDATQIYEFDNSGRHLRTINAMTTSNIYSFVYTNSLLAEIRDGDGKVTIIERAADGTPQAIRSPYGQRTALTITDTSLTALTDPCGQTTRMTYEGCRLTSVVGANGATHTYTIDYDSDGNIIRVTDPAGGFTALGKTTFSNGYQAVSTSALGRVNSVRLDEDSTGNTRRTVTARNGAIQIVDKCSNGCETNQLPDGTKISEEQGPDPRYGMAAPLVARRVVCLPSGLTSTGLFTRAYDGNTLTAAMTFNGRTATSVYAYSNHTMRITSPAGRTIAKSMDSQNRSLIVSAPDVFAVTNTYDTNGRLSSVIMGARVTRFAYDANGFPAVITDAGGRTNRLLRDALGQVTNQVLPDGRSILFAYDKQGNCISVTPSGRAAHTFAYSLVDQCTNYTAPGGTPQVTSYNVERQPIQVDRGGGQVMTYGYDAAGRFGTNDFTGNRVVLSYLANGLLGSISTTGGVTIARAYDGKLVTRIAVSGVVTGMAAYTYNNNFQLVGKTVNGSDTTAYGYDADGIMTNAGLCRLDRASASDFLVGSALSNVTDSFEYNGYGEATNYMAGTNGYAVFSVTYARDMLGRITNARELVLGAALDLTYQYDLAGHLIAVVTNGTGSGTNTCQYDANGNCTNWVVNGIACSAAYDGQDRLINRQSTISTQQYFYNAAGDLTNKTTDTEVTAYTYDGAGHLMAVALPDGRQIAYRIDGLGRRVAKCVDGVFTQGFLYGLGRLPLAELDQQSNIVSRFVYTGANSSPLYMIKAGVVYRMITDHLGSIRLVVQAESGEIAQRLDYDAWGRVTYDSSPGFQPFGFTGGLYDRDSRLVHLGVRYYDAESGRWTTRDPIGFTVGDANLYAYCAGDPINMLDKSGLGPQHPNPNLNPTPNSVPGPTPTPAPGPTPNESANNSSGGTNGCVYVPSQTPDQYHGNQLALWGATEFIGGGAQAIYGGVGVINGSGFVSAPGNAGIVAMAATGVNMYCQGIWDICTGLVTPDSPRSQCPFTVGSTFPLTRNLFP